MLVDAPARLSAATELDRNVVVTAGAGTGKTRLLVDRLVHLLIGKGVPLRRIVALTFTEKAAGEMRLRLAARLEALLLAARAGGTDAQTQSAVGSRQTAAGPEPLSVIRDPSSALGPSSFVIRPPSSVVPEDELQFEFLRRHHRLSSDKIRERAQAALEGLDQSLIGTIHSFAAHVLRLFPVEAGVDPTFDVDTGTAFGDCFAREWAGWLGEELGPRAPRGEAWLNVLERIDLPTVESLARAMSNFLAPSPFPKSAHARRALADAAEAMAGELALAARGCTNAKNNLAAQMTAYAALLKAVAKEGAEAAGGSGGELLDKDVSKAKTGWSETGFEAARERAEAARRFLLACREVDDAFIERLTGLLDPFVVRVRARFLSDRRLSFDGLLALARDLVRDHFRAQERLKREFEAILVDEFQDTDPVQAELLLYLAQKRGRPVTDLKKVELAPGKLFVVGDPKQSIYGFRRADIAAFEWVKNLILQQGGAEYELKANFRSRAGIVDAVNACFEGLLVEEAGIQPRYVPLAVGRGDGEAQTRGQGEGETDPNTNSNTKSKSKSKSNSKSNSNSNSKSNCNALFLHDHFITSHHNQITSLIPQSPH